MKQKDNVICNRCGMTIRPQGGLSYSEYVEVSKSWGYFSRKDGEDHRFDLCEACYDAWISEFQIPVSVEERTELV